MSDKIVVPDGMLEAAIEASGLQTYCTQDQQTVVDAVEAALRWLSENPIVPTPEQAFVLNADCAGEAGSQLVRSLVATWQRRMFRAPEPEIPEELRESGLWCKCSDNSVLGTPCRHNRPLVAAYKLGQQSK